MQGLCWVLRRGDTFTFFKRQDLNISDNRSITVVPMSESLKHFRNKVSYIKSPQLYHLSQFVAKYAGNGRYESLQYAS